MTATGPAAWTRGGQLRALGVSTRTVDRWIREQTGPPATLLPGGRRRWRWGDVQAWLRERREPG